MLASQKTLPMYFLNNRLVAVNSLATFSLSIATRSGKSVLAKPARPALTQATLHPVANDFLLPAQTNHQLYTFVSFASRYIRIVFE